MDHPLPKKGQLSPFKVPPIAYDQKKQLTPDEDTSAPLPLGQIKQIQKNVGSLLYYTCTVNSKLLVALSVISVWQEQATVYTKTCVKILLDYVAMYPNDRIVYEASDMILCGHANAGYLNKTNAWSWAGAHIYLSENDPILQLNGANLTIATSIKFVMASSAEAELAALFITVHKMVPIIKV